MEAKIQLLTEDRTRLQDIEKQHQSLVFENQKLKDVEKANSTLKGQLEVLQDAEKRCTEVIAKAESLQDSLFQLQMENKQIDVLKTELGSLKDQHRNSEMSNNAKDQIIQRHQNEIKELKEAKLSLEEHMETKKKMESKYLLLQNEYESMRKTVDDYQKANTNSEISQQNLMKEISELRLIEAQHKTLLEAEATMKEQMMELEEKIVGSKQDLEMMGQSKVDAEAECKRTEEALIEVERRWKLDQEKVLKLGGELKESLDRNSTLVQDIGSQKKELESIDSSKQEELKKMESLKAELSEVKASRERERADANVQQEKLNELREIEIEYKIVLRENEALKSISDNVKNVTVAFEKNQQTVDILQEKVASLDHLHVQCVELECRNKLLEVELKDGIEKREKLSQDLIELKSENEKLKTQSKQDKDELQQELLVKIAEKEDEVALVYKENELLKQSVEKAHQTNNELIKTKQQLQQTLDNLKKAHQEEEEENETTTAEMSDDQVHKQEFVDELLVQLEEMKEIHGK